MSQPPPQREDAADPPVKPGTADLNFWFSIVECVDPKMIDFERFAEMCSYKNVTTAKWMFYSKRRQMREIQGATKVQVGGEKGVKKEKKRGAVKREAKEVGVVKREAKEVGVVKREAKEVGMIKREVKQEERSVVKQEAKEEVEE